MQQVWVFTKAVISSYLSRKISSVILRNFQVKSHHVNGISCDCDVTHVSSAGRQDHMPLQHLFGEF